MSLSLFSFSNDASLRSTFTDHPVSFDNSLLIIIGSSLQVAPVSEVLGESFFDPFRGRRTKEGRKLTRLGFGFVGTEQLIYLIRYHKFRSRLAHLSLTRQMLTSSALSLFRFFQTQILINKTPVKHFQPDVRPPPPLSPSFPLSLTLPPSSLRSLYFLFRYHSRRSTS